MTMESTNYGGNLQLPAAFLNKICQIYFRNNAVKHVVYYPSLKVSLYHIMSMFVKEQCRFLKLK